MKNSTNQTKHTPASEMLEVLRDFLSLAREVKKEGCSLDESYIIKKCRQVITKIEKGN